MSLINIDKILTAAERSFLLTGADEYVHTIREDKSIPNFYERVEKELRNFPWLGVYKYRKVKEGLVSIARPYKVLVTSRALAEQRPEYLRVKESFTAATENPSSFSTAEFLENYFGLCYRKHSQIKSCLEVYLFLIANKDGLVGLLPRQIPHSQSTKLIGTESLLLSMFAFDSKIKDASWGDFYNFFGLSDRSAEFRIFAPKCQWRGVAVQEFHGILSSQIVDAYGFDGLKNTLVVENLESFLPLIEQDKHTLLIWGSGWKCTLLDELTNILPKPIYYWGDIDKEGIEIASQFSHQTGAKAVFMGLDTLERYRNLAQKIDYVSPERDLILYRDVYNIVCDEKIRIEQEKIVFDLDILGFE
ncbi:MAG: Wadjet anti-phage system protein JetD domain-containing protein [Bacteriovoracaceae bacterium]